jgi:hypothetical protein
MTRICSRADGEVDWPLPWRAVALAKEASSDATNAAALPKFNIGPSRTGVKGLLDPPHRTTEVSDLGYRLTQWN